MFKSLYFRIFFILMIFSSILFTGCKKDNKVTEPDTTLPANVTTYDNTATYQKGNFVIYNGKIYQATTTVRKIVPSSFYTVDATQLLNPWLLSSRSDAIAAQLLDLNSIKKWSSKESYTAGDVILADDSRYYKAMWFNSDTSPLNTITVWREITGIQAFDMNYIKNLNASTGDLKISLNIYASNNIAEVLPVEGTYKLQNSIDQTAMPTVQLSEDSVLINRWSYDTVYIENSVCTYGNKYYRAKWWNKGEMPRNAITPNELWDTPWQEITSDLFRQLYQDTVPKEMLPVVDVDYTDPSEVYADAKKGYIQEWNWTIIDASKATTPLPSDVDDVNFDDIYMAKVKRAFMNSAIGGSANDILLEANDNTVSTLVATKLDVNKWAELFPNGDITYYSYNNFLDAVKMIDDYAYLTVTHKYGNTEYKKVFVLYKKSSGKIRLISQSDYFYNGAKIAALYPAEYKVINFANFLREGTDNDKLRILAAFLAHAAHNTSTYWAKSDNTKTFNTSQFSSVTFSTDIIDQYFMATPVKLKNKIAFSMSINEDPKYKGSTAPNFVYYSREYPAATGKSYHGRGPYMIEGNYNYGLYSAIIFGNSTNMLKDPDIMLNGLTSPAGGFFNASISGGTLGFLTGLMYFMMDRNGMPTMNDVMILNTADGKYNENLVKVKKQANRGQAGFGWTVNIINGNEEDNSDYRNERADDYNPALGSRVMHYTFYSLLFGAKIYEEPNDTGNEKMDTLGYYPY